MNRDKELYRQLRDLPWDELWTCEVPRFNDASPRERLERVAVIRATAVVYSESRPKTPLADLKFWLRSLLNDPQEKIRRYAAAALPKLGADADDERELLAVTTRATSDREKKHLAAALGKIGGKESLKHSATLPSRTVQRLKAKVARTEQPSKIRLDAPLKNVANLALHLHCRSGLETFIADEAALLPLPLRERAGVRGNATLFRVREKHRGLAIITPSAPFTLADIYTMRCFADAGFHVGHGEDIAAVATSPAALQMLTTVTDGPIRYRIDFVAKGHQRAAVAKLAEQIHARAPELINGGGDTPWTLAIRGKHVEWMPKILPDLRFAYRKRDIPAASHPPLAACMARLSLFPSSPSVKSVGVPNEIIWDPFCGSGLELIERALLGGVAKIIGVDLSPQAIEITRQNLAAAKLQNIQTQLVASDFRQFDPGQVSLIITNPPMGKRVPIANLRQLIADLFTAAARHLKPGGRVVFANPINVTPADRSLQRDFSQLIDFGGFHCRLERYVKT